MLPRFKTWAMCRSHEELARKFAQLLAVVLIERKYGRSSTGDALKWRESRSNLRKLISTIESLVTQIKLKEEGRRRGNSKGGKKGAETKRQQASTWQDMCEKAACREIASGKSARTLASTLAARFDKSPQQVRKLLQSAGILPKQKRS